MILITLINYNQQQLMDSKQINGSSDQEVFQHHKIQTQEEAVTPEARAQKIILEAQQQQLKKSSRSILSEDIQLKLEEVLEDIQQDDGKNFQSIISLRMKELAYCKILVLTYQKSYFRLVQAHYHIGKEYLKFKCYEQAMSHLITAIDKNVKATQTSTHKLYHSYMLTSFGQCLYYIEKYDEALKQLSRALNIQEECEQKDKNGASNIDTLKYLALTKVKLKHEDALSNLQSTVAKAKEVLGDKNKQYGLILYEEGKFHLESGNKKEAIERYESAIEIIKLSSEGGIEEDIIKIYQQLAQIHENNNPERYIATLKLKYQVFQDTYGNADKKSIKQQRNLVTALLKYKQIDESLEQCQDILEKQKRVYGENSLEVGKQYRTIANIYLAKHDFKQADANYKKAMKIFHDLGDQRLARQVKVKIASLQIQQRQ